MAKTNIPMTSAPARKLATIRKISDIRPINSATDKAIAYVDKWTVAVNPHKFKKGDLALFVEIDAFLPASDKRFKSLGNMQVQDENSGYRIQTRIYGNGKHKVLSQGHLFDLKEIQEVHDAVQQLRDGLAGLKNEETIEYFVLMFLEGLDFSHQLKISKWEESEEKALLHLGNFPSTIIHKTGHERVQNCPNLFKKTKYKRWLYQESAKMDGSSMTVYFVNRKTNQAAFRALHPLPADAAAVGPNMVSKTGRFGVCTNNYDLVERSDAVCMYWAAARKLELPQKLVRLGRNIAIQGELCGDGINKNRQALPAGTKEFFVFAMWDIDGQKYIHPLETERRAKELGLKHVPVLGYVKLWDIASSHDDLLQRAARRDGEGLVFKCVTDGRWFKVISNTYLLEKGL